MKQYAFGVDLGGTTVKLSLFRGDGALVVIGGVRMILAG